MSKPVRVIIMATKKPKVLISSARIQQRVKELAKEISRDYQDKDLVLIGILKGAFVFLADLARNITIPLALDFIQVSSYGATKASTGVIKIKKDIDLPIVNKDVLIVEDIIDFGYTLDYLRRFISHKKARSVHICALLDKPARHRVDLKVDYLGFTVPDRFLVGYGIDYAERYRNLPYIGYLEFDDEKPRQS